MNDYILKTSRLIPIEEYIHKHLYLKHTDGSNLCIKEILITSDFLNSIDCPHDLKASLKKYLTEEDIVRMILLGINWSNCFTPIEDGEIIREYRVDALFEKLYLNRFEYMNKYRSVTFKVNIKNYILTLLELTME